MVASLGRPVKSLEIAGQERRQSGASSVRSVVSQERRFLSADNMTLSACWNFLSLTIGY